MSCNVTQCTIMQCNVMYACKPICWFSPLSSPSQIPYLVPCRKHWQRPLRWGEPLGPGLECSGCFTCLQSSTTLLRCYMGVSSNQGNLVWTQNNSQKRGLMAFPIGSKGQGAFVGSPDFQKLSVVVQLRFAFQAHPSC